MDKIINILLLIIIFVFDPLAIALVIAANYAFEQLKEKTRENIYGEKELVEDDPMQTSIDLNGDGELDAEEFSEFDVNRDGVVDENEAIYKQEVERIRNIAGVSSWRKNKMIKELKEKLFNNK